MSRSLKQGIIAVGFVGLLIFVIVRGSGERIWKSLQGTGPSGGMTEPDRQESIRRYGFTLQDVARDCGVAFRHESSTLDLKLEHIMPIVAAMGAGATILDFDADGWLDLYVVTSKEGEKNALYRNQHDGTFRDMAGSLGVADLNQPATGACMGAAAADYDNDGYVDLLVYKWGRPELFHNRAGQGFDRVTDSAGLPQWVNANAACWLDYDRDGRLDLFIAGYWSEEIDLWNLKTTKIMPESFEYATNGGRKYLLRNRGDGSFEDVTEAMGIKSTRWTLGVAAADLCDSGYPDLVLANDYGASEFFANREGKKFEEIGYETGIGVAPKSGMSVSFGDALNQGRQAIYVTNITEPGNLVQGNNLWVATNDEVRGAPRYLNQAGVVNVERGGWSWGAKFGDLNNDGWLDLYLTNGYVSANQGESYWYDYGKIAGGLKGLIGDAIYWPPIEKQSLSGYQAKCVWLNKRGDYTDIAAAVGVGDVYDGRAVALGDLFNRGAVDVVVANQNAPLLMYRNEVDKANDWVQFELVGGARPGGEQGWSNRSAVGAKVVLSWRQGAGKPLQQEQVITAGDGYASQNMFRLHFGLGKDAQIEQAEIRWPSGRKQVLRLPALRKLHVIEESAAELPRTAEPAE
jgi:hypothetical protein